MPKRSRLQRNIILSCLCFIGTTTFAKEDVLVGYVPKGATQSQVVAIIKQSFLNRQWVIEKSDENSVTAGLLHRSYDCHITISLSNAALVHEESCIRNVTGGGPNNSFSRKQKSDAPATWVANLRADISQSLAAIPDISQPQYLSDSPNGVAERLKTLQGLRDSGLISEQEFARKRQEILKSL